MSPRAGPVGHNAGMISGKTMIYCEGAQEEGLVHGETAESLGGREDDVGRQFARAAQEGRE
jgi:hypothetical protein